MNFHDAYAVLDGKIRKKVEEEGSEYIPLIPPERPVDFVLIAKEPSLGFVDGSKGNPSSEVHEKRIRGLKNFAWSFEDFMLHFCIREFLCQRRESYYLTDLAKGAMTVNAASQRPFDRYEDWYELLQMELGLVATPVAKIISVGTDVSKFLTAQCVHGHSGTIMHYSAQAVARAGVEIPDNKKAWDQFHPKSEHVLEVAAEVMEEADMGQLSDEILSRLQKGSGITEPRRRLMFDYKIRFERIRDPDNLGWPRFRECWDISSEPG